MKKDLDIKIEKAIRLLAQYVPESDENIRKPVLLHDIRVGLYLYENDCYDDIVIAGILHDTLEEFSSMTEEMIRNNFGKKVLELVKLCTKDYSIEDKKERINDMIKRCAQNNDALVIKAADTIDSFKFYSAENNKEQLTKHCMRNAEAILKYKPENFQDKIFDELKDWLKKYK